MATTNYNKFPNLATVINGDSKLVVSIFGSNAQINLDFIFNNDWKNIQKVKFNNYDPGLTYLIEALKIQTGLRGAIYKEAVKEGKKPEYPKVEPCEFFAAKPYGNNTNNQIQSLFLKTEDYQGTLRLSLSLSPSDQGIILVSKRGEGVDRLGSNIAIDPEDIQLAKIAYTLETCMNPTTIMLSAINQGIVQLCNNMNVEINPKRSYGGGGGNRSGGGGGNANF